MRQAKKPACSWGEIKTACLQSGPGRIEGLSKNLCSATALREGYQIQQYANQVMCMNLQAEGMSNVLKHVVNGHHEVSELPRARIQERKMQEPSTFHNVVLKSPWSASAQPGGSWIPANGD